jgi:hypothetical protein
MGVFKNVVEDVRLTIQQIRVISAWASASIARGMLVMSLLGLAYVGTQSVHVYRLLAEVERNHETRIREMRFLGKELQYKVTLDAITLCLDSEKTAPKLHAWYCGEAIALYQKTSTEGVPGRANELIGKLAYGAMKNDVSQHLRGVEFDRLFHSPATREEEELKLLLSKAGLGVSIFVLILVMSGAYLALRRHRIANQPPKIDVAFQPK